MKMDQDFFPVGAYKLPDGREVVGLDEREVRARAASAWRRQAVADDRLERRLASSPGRPPPVLARAPQSRPVAPPVQLTLADAWNQGSVDRSPGVRDK